MAYAPPEQPHHGVDSSAQPAGPSSTHRRSGQTGRPGRYKLEGRSNLKNEIPDSLESTAEQEHNMKLSSDQLSDHFNDGSKGSEESIANDVLYNIHCRDKQNKRVETFLVAENPFEELSLQDFEESQSRIIMQVTMDANGVGSPLYWAQYAPSPFVPYVGERQLPYEDEFDIRVRPGNVRQYTPSPPRRRANTYSDFNSEVSDENDEDRPRDELFDGPTRQNTFKPDGGAPLSLQEVLNRGIFTASSVHWIEIFIYSRNLVKLFRSVIQRYPGQSLKGEFLAVKAPFEMLAHYYNDLNALRKGASDVLTKIKGEVADDAKQPEVLETPDLLDEATLYDLSVLLRTFKLHYTKNFAPEEARYNIGVTSFRLLWFLYKPGVDVYARIGGKIAGFVFDRWERRGGRERDRYDERGQLQIERDSSSYCVAHCWGLSYNGRRIVKTMHEFYIEKFRGERQITSLPVFPCIYLDKEDGEKTRLRLQDLGEKYYNIIRQSPAHREYCGMAWDLDREEPPRDPVAWQKWKADVEYNGEIVIDHRRGRSFHRIRSRSPGLEYIRERREAIGSAEEDLDSGDELQQEESVAKRTKGVRANFKKINPKEQESLTPHHYFLLPRRMNGYALAKKQRMEFDVEYIVPIQWPPKEIDPMSTLILDDSDKDVVKALARKYSKGHAAWGADFVEGKGEGQIFLLHGPPGTGKTYTVECVAKYTRRPLLRLTVADIGTDERQMEDILGEWFQRGADWGAIILIDEADVFLEKRQVKDLQRNSLVSVFLSCMEYYTGMLFLTTNRIGQIDDAFLSRTSVALTYKTLDTGKQRHIWQGFLRKLGEERKDISLTDRAKKFLENLDKDETTKDVPWNGREIRNALQTAIALASFDAEEEAEESGVKPSKILVRDTHFQTVVDRRKEFIAYRKSIRNQDEEARAYTEGSRAPPPKKG